MLRSSMVNDLLLGQIIYDVAQSQLPKECSPKVGYSQLFKELHPEQAHYILVEPGSFTSKWFGLGGSLIEIDYRGKIYVLGSSRACVNMLSDLVSGSIRNILDQSWLNDPVPVTLSGVSYTDYWGSHVFIAIVGDTVPPRGQVEYTYLGKTGQAFNIGCSGNKCIFVDGNDLSILLSVPVSGEDLEQKQKLYPGYRLSYRIRAVTSAR